MPLEPGTTLGSYAVTAKIGEGGMGEVYQARDTKLDRDVALKVLPEAFTADPDRLARFEREAKVRASLNHPNIGSIYGLEAGLRVGRIVGLTLTGCSNQSYRHRGPREAGPGEGRPGASCQAERHEANLDCLKSREGKMAAESRTNG